MTDDTYAHFNFSYDSTDNWQQGSGSVPYLVRVGRIGMSSAWYVNRLAALPQQTERLLNLFKAYQQYTVTDVRISYTPRYLGGRVTFASDPQVANDPASRLLATLNTSKFTLLVDQDDSGEGANQGSVDEYYQVRDAPNAKTFSYMEPWSFHFRPTVFDVIAQSASGSTMNADVTNKPETLAPLNLSAPTSFKWFSTRVFDNNQNGFGTLNTSINALGVKIYHYTPFNGISQLAQFDIGRYRMDYKFAFRYPEYRTPFGVTLGSVLGGVGEDEAARVAEENALAALLGEGHRIKNVFDQPVLAGGAGQSLVAGDVLAGRSLQTDDNPNTLKRMRTRYFEDRQTQADQLPEADPVAPDPVQS